MGRTRWASIRSFVASLGITAAVVVLSLFVGPVAAHAEPGPTVITAAYGSFGPGNIGSYQLNGNASLGGGGVRLTDDTGGQSGSMFWKQKVALTGSGSFSSEFAYRITSDDGVSGADGFTFCIQPGTNTAVTEGGGLGYEGQPNSLAVEFDTYQNENYDDPNNNHIGIDLDGNVTSVVTADAPYNLQDGEIGHAWIDYDGSTHDLQVRVSTDTVRPADPLIDYNVDLATHYGSEAFIGFTAATGGSWETHDILSWYFDNKFDVGGLTPATVEYTMGAATIDAVASPSVVDLGATSTVTFTVKDADGVAMPDQALAVTATDGAVSTDTVTTDSNGQASVVFTAPDTRETCTVRADATGGMYGAADVTVGFPLAANMDPGSRFETKLSLLTSDVPPGAMGQSVAIGQFPGLGTVAFVGVPSYGTTDAPSCGAILVYVLDPASGQWSPLGGTSDPDAAAGDGFGASVTFSGDMFAIGAPGADGGSGAVYVYTFFGGTLRLTSPNPAEGGGFGSSLATDGQGKLIVGAPHESDPSSAATDTGAAYIYDFNTPQSPMRPSSGTLSFFTKARLASGTLLSGPVAGPSDVSPVAQFFGESSGDAFGTAVSMTSTDAIVGAPFAWGGRDTRDGLAYVFTNDGGWAQSDYVEPSSDAVGGAVGGEFGASVAIEELDGGVHALVGAPADSYGGTGGTVNEFWNWGDGWQGPYRFTGSDSSVGDRFGASVVLDNGAALVGATGASGQDPHAGGVYYYRTGDGMWEIGKLSASDGASDDGFGSSVALSGDVALVGAPGNGDGAGQTYAYQLAYQTPMDTTLTISAPGMLGNDSGGSGSLSVVDVGGPSNGTLEWNADGSFTYTPNEGFTGDDMFGYQVSDGTSEQDSYVLIEVGAAPANTAPVAVDDTATVAENATLTVDAPGVLGNDTDADGDTLTAQLVTDVSNGTLSLASDGSYTYRPNDGFYGDDTFTYVANDGTSDSNAATVTISVYGVARDDTATAYSRPTYITPLANDDPGVGDVATFTQPADGVVVHASDAAESPANTTAGPPSGYDTLVYTPNAGFLGDDTFQYTTTSGQTATVTVTVLPGVSAPAGVGAARETSASVEVTWTAPSSFGSGFASYQVSWRSQGSSGWNYCDAIGSADALDQVVTGLVPGVTYDFRVTVTDTGEYSATSDSATFFLVGDAPGGVVPPVTVPGGVTATFTVGGVSGDASLSVDPDVGDTVPGVGTVTIDGLHISVVPDPGFSGVIQLPVTVTQDGASSRVYAQITVDPSDPYSVTFGPASAKVTLVQWADSTNATGYRIYVNGSVVATTGAHASSFSYPHLLGPNAGVAVQAIGNGGTSSRIVRAVYKPKGAVIIGTVTFGPNSAALSKAAKATLSTLAALVKVQGFKTLTIYGWTAKGSPGSVAVRKRLSARRAAAVKAYLLARFKVLKIESPKIAVVGKGAAGSTIAAKFRMAQVVLK